MPTGVVTFLLTDIVGSTRLWETAPRDMAEALARHDALIDEAVVAHGGTVLKPRGEGDSTFSVFWRAADAVSAALAAQESLTREPWPEAVPLRVRMAVHAGATVERQGDYYGPEVNRAARVRAIAQGGQILVTQPIADEIAGDPPGGAALVTLGMWSLRDVTRPEHIYRLESGAVAAPEAPSGPVAVPWHPAVPLPARLAAFPTTGFVGREAELDRLWGTAGEVATGARRVVLLTGEPGIGKTRLVAEVARRAHEAGITVLYGRCEEDLGVPYQPFAEAVSHYLDHGPQAVIDNLAGRHGSHLARIAPALGERLAGLPVLPAGDPETERYRLLEAVVGLAASASADVPLLVVLEDLHWADRNTLLLLRHLVQAPDPMRVLLVLTYRDSDVPSDHPLAAVLTALRGNPAVDRLRLGGLDADAMVALVADLADRALDDEDDVALAHWLWNETDGNPLFAHEVIRHLVDSRAIRRVEGQWRLAAKVDELSVPDSVREITRRRVARLGEFGERVLTTASVIGRDFDVGLVAAVLDAGEDDVLDVLDRAVTANLVGEVPAVAGRFTFVHALIGTSLYEGLGPTRRIRAHQKVAEAIEAGGDLKERLGELASHWVAAATPATAERVIAWTRRAGDDSLERLAPDEAVRWFGHALTAVDDAGASDAVRCDVLISLGIAQRQSGDDRFRATLLDAARLAGELGDPDALVLAALANNRGIYSSAGVVDTERVAVLEAAAEAVGPADSSRRAMVLATLAAELTFGRDWDRRKALADEAVAVARRLGDDATLARVLNLRHGTIQVPETLAERLADTAENLEVTARLGDPFERYFALECRLRAVAETDALVEEGDRLLEELDRLGDELGQPALRWYPSFHRAWRMLLAGDLEETDRLAVLALQLGNDAHEPEAVAIYAAVLVSLRRDQGRLDEVESLIAQAAADNPGIPGFRALLAVCYCELDRLDDARRVFAPDATGGFADMPRDLVWSSGVCMYAEVAARLGDKDAARVLLEQIRPFTGTFAHSGAVMLGAVDRYVGLLEATTGRLDAAEEHLAAAARLHEHVGAPVWLARTRLDWAELLLRRDAPGDRQRAAGLAAAAREAAERIGAATIARRAARLEAMP